MHIYRLETIGSLDSFVARGEVAPISSAGGVLVRATVQEIADSHLGRGRP